jgi:23S rRNA (uracil1939-C5)-methyltransferase
VKYQQAFKDKKRAKKPEVEKIDCVHQEILELECLRLTSDGSGIGYDKGKATFVAGLLPGEVGQVQIIEQKKNWQKGNLLSIIKESKERVEPPCTVFSTCGGCQLQHLNYAQTLEWKKNWVEDALKRIGKVPLENVKIYPTIGMDEPWRYRNKARLHRGVDNKLGYYQEKSNWTVRFSDCLLISEQMNGWVHEVEDNLRKIPSADTIRTITFRENTRGEGMAVLDSVQDKLPFITETQPMFKFEDKLKNIQSLWGINGKGVPELLDGEVDFTEEVLGLEYKISPLAFLQVNPIQTQKLYNITLDWAELSSDKVVWDLYSGIGTITLALAANAKKVWGIEENPYAVEDARRNARHNQISNVEFIAGKVEETFRKITEKPDRVVLDPPRAGAHRSVLDHLIELKPSRIVYVSCDPGTLARDLGILQTGGYRVLEVQPVDMFPWTHSVETVVLIARE